MRRDVRSMKETFLTMAAKADRCPFWSGTPGSSYPSTSRKRTHSAKAGRPVARQHRDSAIANGHSNLPLSRLHPPACAGADRTLEPGRAILAGCSIKTAAGQDTF